MCEHGEVEEGCEKIAIYIDTRTKSVTHAARQLENGHWTSKLGGWEDIEHWTLDALKGDPCGYGDYVRFMKRPQTL